MRSHPDKPQGWRRRCETCQRKVKHRRARYCCQACVPRSVRVANGMKSRATFAYRKRAMTFRNDLARLGTRLTREDMLAVFWSIYQRAYNSGFQTGRNRTGTLAEAKARGAA